MTDRLASKARSFVVATWLSVQEHFAAYALVLPGDPSFICQPETCDAACCRNFSVSVSERDRTRLGASLIDPADLLEVVDGKPLRLPLQAPYLLQRRDGQCARLGDDRSCGIYDHRPDACRLYPHQVLWIDRASGKRRPVEAEVESEAVALIRNDTEVPPHLPVPLLVRHRECPGFNGPPHGDASWFALLTSVSALQREMATPG